MRRTALRYLQQRESTSNTKMEILRQNGTRIWTRTHVLANTTPRNKIHCSQDVHNICWRKGCSVLCDHAATLTTVTPRRVTRATRSRQTTVTNSPVLAFTLTPARASHLRRVIHHRRHHGHGRARTGGGQNEDMLTPTHIASCAHVSFGLKSVSSQTSVMDADMCHHDFVIPP